MAKKPNEQLTEQTTEEPIEQAAEERDGQEAFEEPEAPEESEEPGEPEEPEESEEPEELEAFEELAEPEEAGWKLDGLEEARELEELEESEEPDAGAKPARRKKSGYHLMLFLDGKDGMIRQMGISKGFVDSLIVVVLILILIPFAGWKRSLDKADEIQGRLNQSIAEYEELAAQKSELETVNMELINKVTILSDTVNAKVEKETALEKESDKAHMPSGFPLSSSASMEASEEEGSRMVIFTAESGNVLAAGAGIVSEITADDHYAKKLSIDHENGYVTVYYNNGTPLVKEGDQVLGNSILFIIGEDNAKLGYEIYYDGTAQDPMMLINIDG